MEGGRGEKEGEREEKEGEGRKEEDGRLDIIERLVRRSDRIKH